MTMEVFMQVEVFFLGEPRIYINKEEKVVGKKKLEALLFFLLFHEKMDRSEIISVFWPSHEPVKGKSSLRNSLYEIRRGLGVDLFAASTRERVQISKGMILFKDVDGIVETSADETIRDYSSTIFMQNRELKNNPSYETWLFSMRDAYQSILIGNLRKHMQRSLLSGESQRVITMAKDILEAEPYDEMTLRSLMKHYAQEGQYNDALAAFLKMKVTLEEDLAVEPEIETLKLADYIQEQKLQSEYTPKTKRTVGPQLNALKDTFNSFEKAAGWSHALVQGEIGSGRSDLIHRFLDSVQKTSHQFHLGFLNQNIPQGFLLKWRRHFKGQPIEDFRNLSLAIPNNQMVIVIENLEYIDPESLAYLVDFLSFRQNQVFFILKTTLSFAARCEPLNILVYNEQVSRIDVPPLTKKTLLESLTTLGHSFIEPLGGERLESAYEYSQGNLLLAQAYLEPKRQLDLFFVQLTVGLTKHQKHIMEVSSIYPQGFDPALIQHFCWQPMEWMDQLKELTDKRLLVEDRGRLHIKYPPLREWIYNQLPEFYRVNLHQLAAKQACFPKASRREEARWRAWHFKRAHDEENYLLHQLLLLELTLNFYDQMFPSDLEADDFQDHSDHQRLKQYALLEDVVAEVELFYQQQPSVKAARMLLVTGYLRGRRMIAGGRQDEGVICICEVLKQAEAVNDLEYQLKATIELIHYGIQKDDRTMMDENIRQAEHLILSLDEGEDQHKRAEVLRLSGLNKFNLGNYEEALARLNEAEEILKHPRYAKTGFLARAGTLNYIARTREAMGDIIGADQAFLASIDLVKGRMHKCLDILYAEYGRFLWTQGRAEAAEEILGLALKEYQVLGTHWKRASSEAILGLIRLKEGNLKVARSHLVNAQIYHKADRRKGEEVLIEELAREMSRLTRRKMTVLAKWQE